MSAGELSEARGRNFSDFPECWKFVINYESPWKGWSKKLNEKKHHRQLYLKFKFMTRHCGGTFCRTWRHPKLGILRFVGREKKCPRKFLKKWPQIFPVNPVKTAITFPWFHARRHFNKKKNPGSILAIKPARLYRVSLIINYGMFWVNERDRLWTGEGKFVMNEDTKA